MAERTQPDGANSGANPAGGVVLSDLIGPDRVFTALSAPDKPALLAELGRRSGEALGRRPEDIRAALAAREELGSTGIGAGIAVPHARLAGLAAPVGFFARMERPVDFAAIDGVKVDLVFLLLSPPSADAAHLASLAAISRRLRRPENASAIRNAATAAAIRVILVGSRPD